MCHHLRVVAEKPVLAGACRRRYCSFLCLSCIEISLLSDASPVLSASVALSCLPCIEIPWFLPRLLVSVLY
eukprot:COSAG02_NODE_6797_length_3355_cov_2.061732_3_plen_71_part_00